LYFNGGNMKYRLFDFFNFSERGSNIKLAQQRNMKGIIEKIKKEVEEKIRKASETVSGVFPGSAIILYHIRSNIKFTPPERPIMEIQEDGTLFVNLLTVYSLPQEEVNGVLLHEMLHLYFNHFGRLIKNRTYFDKYGFSLIAIASDLAINSIVDAYSKKSGVSVRLPEAGCIPGKPPFEYFPKFLSAEDYLEYLRNYVMEVKQDEIAIQSKGEKNKPKREHSEGDVSGKVKDEESKESTRDEEKGESKESKSVEKDKSGEGGEGGESREGEGEEDGEDKESREGEGGIEEKEVGEEGKDISKEDVGDAEEDIEKAEKEILKEIAEKTGAKVIAVDRGDYYEIFDTYDLRREKTESKIILKPHDIKNDKLKGLIERTKDKFLKDLREISKEIGSSPGSQVFRVEGEEDYLDVYTEILYEIENVLKDIFLFSNVEERKVSKEKEVEPSDLEQITIFYGEDLSRQEDIYRRTYEEIPKRRFCIVVVDTSASIDSETLEKMLLFITSILSKGEIEVLFFAGDTSLRSLNIGGEPRLFAHLKEMEDFENVKEITGGGGTDMLHIVESILQYLNDKILPEETIEEFVDEHISKKEIEEKLIRDVENLKVDLDSISGTILLTDGYTEWVVRESEKYLNSLVGKDVPFIILLSYDSDRKNTIEKEFIASGGRENTHILYMPPTEEEYFNKQRKSSIFFKERLAYLLTNYKAYKYDSSDSI